MPEFKDTQRCGDFHFLQHSDYPLRMNPDLRMDTEFILEKHNFLSNLSIMSLLLELKSCFKLIVISFFGSFFVFEQATTGSSIK